MAAILGTLIFFLAYIGIALILGWVVNKYA